MPNIPVENCCGCTACFNICPRSAITMQPDEEGFAYPLVDLEHCISCGLCEKRCPILNPPQLSETYTGSYVIQHNDPEVLETSTSGGFIDALYRYILEEQQGYAVGVAYNGEFLPAHILTDSYTFAKRFRGSKYAQSDLGTIFREISEQLSCRKPVVFVGTPCQVAGLRCFLGKEYDELVTVDIVCRSVPSPKFWKMYLDWQEKRYGQKIESVSCRKKTYGYHSGTLELRFSGGGSYSGSNRVDYFMKSFHGDICSRPSCYQCSFKTKHRCSDFTVFDSWNPQQVSDGTMIDDDRGFSNVLVHTEKGKLFLKKLENVSVYNADPEQMFVFTGGMEIRSITRKEERKTFYKDLDAHGFEKAVRRYINVSKADRIIEWLKPFRYYLKKKIGI